LGSEDLGFCVTDAGCLCDVALAKIFNGCTVTFEIIDITADGYFYYSTDPGAVLTTGTFSSP
jgi:hypothetical protein